MSYGHSSAHDQLKAMYVPSCIPSPPESLNDLPTRMVIPGIINVSDDGLAPLPAAYLSYGVAVVPSPPT